MSPVPFLKCVAHAYADRYEDLSDFVFIFPNLRSGTFFLKYLREKAQVHALLAPQTITLTDFMFEVCRKVEASRIDLLFKLYVLYKDINEKDGNDKGVEFDAFRSWGDVILDDFNDVDLSGADALQLFKNVKDYNEIQSQFLTDEQRAVMKEYFGISEPENYAKEFWKSFSYKTDDENRTGRKTEIKTRFLLLWEVMGQLYQRLHEELDNEGLAYTGMAYREAEALVKENGPEAWGSKKLVFVGHHDLAATARSMMTAMKKMSITIKGHEEPAADFVWDFTGPYMNDDRNTSMREVKLDIKAFGKPEWLDLSPCDVGDQEPEITSIACPSNSIQTKIVGELLQNADKGNEAERIAVVLPDEGLLLPLLYSLPEDTESLNLTMGYPLRLTSTISFVGLLRLLQSHKRQLHKGTKEECWGWFHEDLRLLLSHPFIRFWWGAEAVNRLKRDMNRSQKYTLTTEDVTGIVEEAALILQPLTTESTPEEAENWIRHIFKAVESRMLDEGRKKWRLDLDHLNVYRDALTRLSDAVKRHNIEMGWREYLHLADRLLGSEKVRFEGEPVKGLQVMGMLETRGLDFDHVLVPSMNERIFPRRMRKRSFVPQSLRKAYGMPDLFRDERTYAYYFYRLLSRAKRVELLYDARTAGLNTGEPSRYLQQLEHLYARGKMKMVRRGFELRAMPVSKHDVAKDATALALIEEYKTDKGNRRLSASLLNHYLKCPKSFYYLAILGIKDDPEPSQYLNAVEYGDALHEVMRRLYLPELEKSTGGYLAEPKMMTADKMDRLLADRNHIERLATEAINHKHYHLFGKEESRELDRESLRNQRNVLVEQVMRVLRHDRALAPWLLHGCEVKRTMGLDCGEAGKVDFTFTMDRLDQIKDPKTGEWKLRIIDYKSGNVHLEAKLRDDVVNGEYRAGNAFQLLLYAWLLNRDEEAPEEVRRLAADVRMEIYCVGYLDEPKDDYRFMKIEGAFAPDYEELSEWFEEALKHVVDSLFDPGDFRAQYDPKRCGYCAYAAECR